MSYQAVIRLLGAIPTRGRHSTSSIVERVNLSSKPLEKRSVERGLAPISLSARTVGWRERDIHAWLESKAGRKLDFSPMRNESAPRNAPSDPGPVSGDEFVTTLAALLLRAVTLESLQQRRRPGRPPSSAPAVGPATMESVVVENRILRQLLVDALVELESVREQMRGRRTYPRSG